MLHGGEARQVPGWPRLVVLSGFFQGRVERVIEDILDEVPCLDALAPECPQQGGVRRQRPAELRLLYCPAVAAALCRVVVIRTQRRRRGVAGLEPARRVDRQALDVDCQPADARSGGWTRGLVGIAPNTMPSR